MIRFLHVIAVLLLISFSANAQVSINEKGFSFQGIAYDDLGNARTNASVEVIFSIDSWSEKVTLITDGFGVFHHVIGESNNDFTILDFAENQYTLKVTIGGAEIYNGQFNAVPYARVAENAVHGVPVGTIMPYVGTTAPYGWLLCDGTPIPVGDQYSDLETLLGSTWGSSKTPDLRGMFLRGAGGGGGASLGVRQDDQFESHSHAKGSLSMNSTGSHTHYAAYNSSGGSDKLDSIGSIAYHSNSGEYEEYQLRKNTSTANVGKTNKSGSHTHTISGSTASTGGTGETRPVNVSINYIIKW